MSGLEWERAPDGYRWAWLPDECWTTEPAAVAGRGCRANAAPGRKACGRPAVAALRRRGGRGAAQWWCYCELHLYGRRVEDGVVIVRRTVPLDEQLRVDGATS